MAITDPCFVPIKACGFRAVRLDANGAFATGSDNSYVSDAMTVVRYRPATLDGEEFLQRNACGDIVVDFIDDDRPRGRGDLEMTLCQLDAELAEILAGGTILVSGTDSVGYEPPGIDDAVPNGVALEVWAYAWDGDERAQDDAGNNLFYRFAFPKVKFAVGDTELQNGVQLIPLTGNAQPNSNFGTGPAGDWPAAISQPGSWDLVTSMPAAVCGTQEMAIAS